jgi:putative N6-adenine-specific DNA methylase
MKQAPERLPLFAITAPGLEPLAAAELREMGVSGAAEAGGVAWEGTAEQLYDANLRLRTASRLLVRVGEFRARTFFELERHARRLAWERFIAPGREVRLRVTCRKSRLYHEGAVAQRFHEAIEHRTGSRAAEAAMDAGAAEEAQEGAEAQLFIIRFLHDRCTVSADASGALLHQRGYRQALSKAPLRETLAAALLLASGWRGQAPLVDPLCGSGTIAIEAALLARNIAPGLADPERAGTRHYAFKEWPDFEPEPWERIVARARAECLPAADVAIHASDRDAGAIETARANAERAGVLEDLVLSVQPISALAAIPGPGWLVSNPPYGVRVGDSQALRNLYATLGKVARERLPEWTLAILSADRRLEAQLGLRFSEFLKTSNGGIPVRLVVAKIEG